MSGQHTPGPWTYHADSGSSCAALIATGSFVCEFIEPPTEANARLIAAAPELLEALKSIICSVGHDDGDGWYTVSLHEDEVQAARAAIAKATGEQ
jgi:hypothetical protein